MHDDPRPLPPGDRAGRAHRRPARALRPGATRDRPQPRRRRRLRAPLWRLLGPGLEVDPHPPLPRPARDRRDRAGPRGDREGQPPPPGGPGLALPGAAGLGAALGLELSPPNTARSTLQTTNIAKA